MREYLPLIYLALALLLAAIVTRWFNWIAWGARKAEKMERMAKHIEKRDGKNAGSTDGPKP